MSQWFTHKAARVDIYLPVIKKKKKYEAPMGQFVQ